MVATLGISADAEAVWNSGVGKTEGEYQGWSWRDSELRLVSACAIGAACYKRDPGAHIETQEDAIKVIPELAELVSFEGFAPMRPLMEVIIELNDHRDLNAEEVVEQLRELGI